MRSEALTTGAVARRPRRARALARFLLAFAALLAVAAALVGLVFAGSPATLAEGVRVAGVDVGGMTVDSARRELQRRAAAVARVPVVFTAAGKRFEIEPASLGVRADWDAALAAARNDSEGFAPVRGFRRLHARFFGAEIAPPVRAYAAALDYQLGRLAQAVDRRHVESSLVREGLSVALVPGQSGRVLDRRRAARAIVHALASLERAGPVALPVAVDPVHVSAADLRPALAQARTALSAPVRLAYGETRWKLPRWRIAELLRLPAGGETTLAIAGPKAERWFRRLQLATGRAPVDATFAVDGSTVEVVPARPGISVDAARTAKALLAAAVSPSRRVAELAVAEAAPGRTTAEAQAMGIRRRLSSFSTAYAGTPDRITNLRLAVNALDGTLLAPGDEFSFNGVVGERTAERGFRPAPVIYDNAYAVDVGGGVSQVATTVFNAVWEAGLKITERNPHLFYISRYPLGRDATVNYPDLDLRFRNDTRQWLLVKGGYDAAGITVSIYGGEKREVESIPSPRRITGPPPVKRVKDPTLAKGETELVAAGTPASATTVKRIVRAADGTVLYDETWNTSYRGEYRIVRVGAKPKAKPKPPKDSARADALTTDEAAPAPARP